MLRTVPEAMAVRAPRICKAFSVRLPYLKILYILMSTYD